MNDLSKARFIRRRLELTPVAGLPAMHLYKASRSSGLGRHLAHRADAGPPYWAYCWAGGLALARHFAANPGTVAGRDVLDLGSGGGVVAIAAAMAGARNVVAVETDPFGRVALALNAEANGVALTIGGEDLLDGQAPTTDVVTVGDLCYDAALASRVTAFLDRCALAGIVVLLGDPGRRYLPLHRLTKIAEYDVADFALSEATVTSATVFRFGMRDPVAAASGLADLRN